MARTADLPGERGVRVEGGVARQQLLDGKSTLLAVQIASYPRPVDFDKSPVSYKVVGADVVAKLRGAGRSG